MRGERSGGPRRGDGRIAALRSLAVAGLLTIIWGTTWGAIRVSLQGIPPLSGVALRFAIAGCLLFLVARLLRVELGGGRRVVLLWVWTAVTTFAGGYGITYWAEQWIPSGLASILFATFPLFVIAGAHFVLPAERLTWRRAAGSLVGFGGIVVVFSNELASLGGGQVLFASLVMLGSPILAALGQVAVKRWGEDLHPFTLTAPPMLLAAVLTGLAAGVVERGAEFRFAPAPVLALVYLAVVGSALTFTLYYWLLSQHSATDVSLVSYGIPVVAVVVGALFLGEELSPRPLLGATLVILGVWLATWRTQPSSEVLALVEPGGGPGGGGVAAGDDGLERERFPGP